LSKIILGVVSNNKEMTRHENRFGITSFIYRARRPFHPGRLYDYFLDPFFIFHGSRKEEIEETSKLEKLQKDAGLKQVTQKIFYLNFQPKFHSNTTSIFTSVFTPTLMMLSFYSTLKTTAEHLFTFHS
jgi:hypothetical protein